MSLSTSPAAVTRMAGDVASLLRQVRSPQRPVLGSWSVADLAVHMLHVFDFELDVVRRSPLPPVHDFDDLGRATLGYVAAERSRDLKEIADRIESTAAAFTAAAGDRTDLYDGLGGARPPRSALHAPT